MIWNFQGEGGQEEKSWKFQWGNIMKTLGKENPGVGVKTGNGIHGMSMKIFWNYTIILFAHANFSLTACISSIFLYSYIFLWCSLLLQGLFLRIETGFAIPASSFFNG